MSQLTGESERYRQFLDEQNTRVNGWGEERRKKLATEQPNVRLLQTAVSPSASPTRNPAPLAPKEVPIAVVPPSPLKQERELNSTLHTSERLNKTIRRVFLWKVTCRKERFRMRGHI